MSDQSPWGTPPPSRPYGSPPPQQPAGPSYGPPPQPPGGGWPAPPSYGGAPGPRRRRTGTIVAIVAAVIVVVSAFTVTFVVASGGDDPEPTVEDDTSATTGESTGETTGEVAPGGGDIVGDGYSYDLPDQGWQDAIDEVGSIGPGTENIDTFIILGSSVDLAQSNILVEVLSAATATSVDDLSGLWKRNLSGTDNATVEDLDDLDLDGERAVGARIPDRVNANGLPITQLAYLAIHEGRQYSVVLTFPRTGDAVSEGDFEAVLASWSWAS